MSSDAPKYNFKKTTRIINVPILYILLWSCLVKGKWLVFAVFLCHHLQQAPVVLFIILLYGLKGDPTIHNLCS